jgi:hypothetical protein
MRGAPVAPCDKVRALEGQTVFLLGRGDQSVPVEDRGPQPGIGRRRWGALSTRRARQRLARAACALDADTTLTFRS